jgi:tRNA A37 threonylcarbamoyladenosine synthetase subunit TsaC/SUA5/YrdC
MVAGGGVLIVPICGVIGFVCDGRQPKAIEKIFELKGRDRAQTLITAGGPETRERLADLDKLSPVWTRQSITTIYDLPVLVVFRAASAPAELVRPDLDRPEIGTVAVWWANFYTPIATLEECLHQIKPDAFLAGTSCNMSGRPSITRTPEAAEVFGRHPLLSAVLRDADFDEGRGLLSGSHTMLRIVGDHIVPLRAGSVHTDSLKAMLGDSLRVPQGFANLASSTIVDVSAIRTNRHYLR